jgi:uncharacterized repeat protein (TIGR01451 family)
MFALGTGENKAEIAMRRNGATLGWPTDVLLQGNTIHDSAPYAITRVVNISGASRTITVTGCRPRVPPTAGLRQRLDGDPVAPRERCRRTRDPTGVRVASHGPRTPAKPCPVQGDATTPRIPGLVTSQGTAGGHARLPRPPLSVGLTIMIAALVLVALLPARAVGQGCGYGTGGPNASTICWLNLAGYSDSLARSAAGQAVTLALPGGYMISFTLTSRGTPSGQQRSVGPNAIPVSGSSYVGNHAYRSTPGRPALYTATGSVMNTTTTIALSNIQVRDAGGVPVSGYAMVGADAETTNYQERITWTSEKPIDEVANLRPAAVSNGCQNNVFGLGTTTVTCSGNVTPAQPYGTEIVAADAPTAFAQAIGLVHGSNREAVAFGVLTSRIEVVKNVDGRVRSSDSFDVSAMSPTGSTVGSATTGSANSARTGALTVLPPATGSVYTLAESPTPATGTRLEDYQQSWSCTNNGVADPSLPSGDGNAVTVAPAPGDDIACTVTNRPRPDLSISKTPSEGEVPPGGGQVIYRLLIENEGPGNATGVTVTDPVAPGLTLLAARTSQGSCSIDGGRVECDLGQLVAGGSALVLVAAEAGEDAGKIVNTATVGAAEPDRDPSDNRAAATVRVQPTPPPPAPPTPPEEPFDLVVSKRFDHGSVSVGESVTYTVVVSNKGPAPAADVKLIDVLNAPVKVKSVETTSGTCTKRIPIRCSLGRMGAGREIRISIVAKHVDRGCRQINAAGALGAGTDDRPRDNLDGVSICVKKGRPELKISKRAGSSRARPGGVVAYRIGVKNKGDVAAHEVKTCDRLPEGQSVLRAPGAERESQSKVCWTLERLEPGQRERFRIVTQIDLDAALEPQMNRASVRAANAPRRQTAKERVGVSPAGGACGVMAFAFRC